MAAMLQFKNEYIEITEWKIICSIVWSQQVWILLMPQPSVPGEQILPNSLSGKDDITLSSSAITS